MSIEQLVEGYREKIELEIAASIPTFGQQSLLRDACAYALKNGGKRFRPAIVHMVAEALGGRDVSQAALAVEFFHTASLIADDLPCMDDADERRYQPALHIEFDEATALLATYALISAGYERIASSPLAVANAAKNTGVFGATGGQFFDLFPPEVSEEVVRDCLQRKTGTLFEIAFVLGWVFGGGDERLLGDVEALAGHFGMAFQIADDFSDYEEDAQEGRAINYPLVVGKKKALVALQQELEGVHRLLAKLGLDTVPLRGLVEVLQTRAGSFLVVGGVSS